METLSLKGLTYDIKILMAWGECISGNDKITQWLMKNGFMELGLFRYALRNEERSRDWLMQNGHPHLMALINGIERNEKALRWLAENGFEVMHTMALAADGDDDAKHRLSVSAPKVFTVLAGKMEFVKDDIEKKKWDYHRYSSGN